MTAREYHDETLPQKGAKTVRFGGMDGPDLRNMKSNGHMQKIAAEPGVSEEEALKQGLDAKAREFVAMCAEVYTKV